METNGLKKYEFTGEIRTVYGVTLRQIRALRDIDAIGISAGDIGGWIEKDGNLWHRGNAWVYENALVSGDALVYENACVCGNAWVCGDAQVYENACVCGNAWVSGDAQVCGDALVCGDAHYLLVGPIENRNDWTTFVRDRAGTIYVKCGCFYGTIEQFRARVKKTYGDSTHGRAYQLAADLAETKIDTTPMDDSIDAKAAEYLKKKLRELNGES